jgi:hypothetical protein
MPGLVGLNNMKNNDYANAVIQMLARVTPVRDFFLIPANYKKCSSLLVQRFGELLRKIWNPKNFKGQVRLCNGPDKPGVAGKVKERGLELGTNCSGDGSWREGERACCSTGGVNLG